MKISFKYVSWFKTRQPFSIATVCQQKHNTSFREYFSQHKLVLTIVEMISFWPSNFFKDFVKEVELSRRIFARISKYKLINFKMDALSPVCDRMREKSIQRYCKSSFHSKVYFVATNVWLLLDVIYLFCN